MATILVPIAATGGPTAKPPFGRSRRWHPRQPLPDSACLAYAGVRPAVLKLLPACRCAPIAGSRGRSATVGTCPGVHATALPCPAPKAHHSTPHAYHATGGLDCPLAEPHATSARRSTTAPRSTPSVRPFARSRNHTEQLQNEPIPPFEG
jgi:hypothetical protein